MFEGFWELAFAAGVLLAAMIIAWAVVSAAASVAGVAGLFVVLFLAIIGGAVVASRGVNASHDVSDVTE